MHCLVASIALLCDVDSICPSRQLYPHISMRALVVLTSLGDMALLALLVQQRHSLSVLSPIHISALKTASIGGTPNPPTDDACCLTLSGLTE